MKSKNNWFVYIIECQNGSFYTGITKDIEYRLDKHTKGLGAKYTRSNPPKEVIYTEKYVNMNDALKREAEIKKLSKNEKIELVKNV